MENAYDAVHGTPYASAMLSGSWRDSVRTGTKFCTLFDDQLMGHIGVTAWSTNLDLDKCTDDVLYTSDDEPPCLWSITGIALHEGSWLSRHIAEFTLSTNRNTTLQDIDRVAKRFAVGIDHKLTGIWNPNTAPYPCYSETFQHGQHWLFNFSDWTGSVLVPAIEMDQPLGFIKSVWSGAADQCAHGLRRMAGHVYGIQRRDA